MAASTLAVDSRGAICLPSGCFVERPAFAWIPWQRPLLSVFMSFVVRAALDRICEFLYSVISRLQSSSEGSAEDASL